MAFRVRNVGEGVVLAFDAMRASKLRSALTVLGVVIGVTTVMVMASLVEGIRSQIFASIETASPETFYVIRFFSSTPLNPQNLPPEVRARPVVNERDAAAIAAMPEIAHAGLWVQVQQRMEYYGVHSQTVLVWGRRPALSRRPGRQPARGALVLERRTQRRRTGDGDRDPGGAAPLRVPRPARQGGPGRWQVVHHHRRLCPPRQHLPGAGADRRRRGTVPRHQAAVPLRRHQCAVHRRPGQAWRRHRHRQGRHGGGIAARPRAHAPARRTRSTS